MREVPLTPCVVGWAIGRRRSLGREVGHTVVSIHSAPAAAWSWKPDRAGPTSRSPRVRLDWPRPADLCDGWKGEGAHVGLGVVTWWTGARAPAPGGEGARPGGRGGRRQRWRLCL